MNEPIQVLDRGFIQLIDTMGDDNRIVQAARTSYGNENQVPDPTKDRRLIRRLMMDAHTSPFEMVEFCFCVQVPMDCWRQWVRHRTANINEYSTRYAEALDFFQVADGWRLQATDNKQGSGGYLEDWPEGVDDKLSEMDMLSYRNTFPNDSPADYLSHNERYFHDYAKMIYKQRLSLGVAKEQARKDLPLSTYTRAYWKCDLHNIFNFLRLRMDSHAQLEIRTYANALATIVKSVCPVAYEAFEDYVLYSCRFSRMEMEIVRNCIPLPHNLAKPTTMTDYEWASFLKKLS